MKGVAMKLGQVLSAMELPVGSPEEREAFKTRLGALRDAAPALAFEHMEKVLVGELCGAVANIFDDFDHEGFAAASIGQVHRAVLNGQAVAVRSSTRALPKPWRRTLRNLGVLPPLLKPLAPDTDFRALIQEIRDAIGEELDYEADGPPAGPVRWTGGRGEPQRMAALESTRTRLGHQGLVRPRHERMIAGVAAGIARRFRTSPTFVRVLLVLSLLLPGPQILALLRFSGSEYAGL